MVGIVIPYADRPSLLASLLHSLYPQAEDVGGIAIVIVDNGDVPLTKTPASTNTCRVRRVRIHSSLGVQGARNTGWAELTSVERPKYILFCDQDVVWHEASLVLLKRTLDAAYASDPAVAYAYSDFRWSGNLEGTWRAGAFSAERLRQDNYISTMSLCLVGALKKSLGESPFSPEVHRLQDWDLWLGLLSEGYKGVHVPKTLFTAYCSEGGVSLRSAADLQYWRQKVRNRHLNRRVVG